MDAHGPSKTGTPGFYFARSAIGVAGINLSDFTIFSTFDRKAAF
jgi:hypothetical protein